MKDVVVTLIDCPPSSETVTFKVRVYNSACLGKQARLTIKRTISVTGSGGINSESLLWQEQFVVASRHTIEMPRSKLGNGYDYQGTHIEIRLESLLHIDDSALFDTRVSTTHSLQTVERRSVSQRDHALAQPTDKMAIRRALGSVSGWDRAWILTVVAGNAIFIIGVLAFVVWAWPKSARRGVELIAYTLLCAGGSWAMIRTRLRKYMILYLRKRMLRIDPHTRIKLNELIGGKTRIALTGARIRVVAYNVEMGERQGGKKDNRKIVKFEHPILAVLLCSRVLPPIPTSADLASFLEDEIDFGPIFDVLYPPYVLPGPKGLGVRIEFQLLHPELADQELILRPRLRFEDFNINLGCPQSQMAPDKNS